MSLQQLPRDMKLEIFHHLEPNELYNIALSSKDFSKLVKDDFIWKNRITKYKSNKRSYYAKYKYSYELEQLMGWLKKYIPQYDLHFEDEKIVIKSNTIYLKDKVLGKIPAGLGKITNLEQIDFTNTKLKEIPHKLGNLFNLRSLNLQNNQLEKIPVELGNLSNLRVLWLNNNRLKEIPVELGNLFNLIDLRLNNNRLEEIPAELGNLPNLKKLYLNNNKLKEIPMGFANPKLFIYLDNNPLCKNKGPYNSFDGTWCFILVLLICYIIFNCIILR